MSPDKNIDLENNSEQQSNTWDDAIPMLRDEDQRIRNRGVNVLLHRLSIKSDFQLLQSDEQSYREGFNLLLDRVEDENHTVRMFAVTSLAVVLESIEGIEEYDDIYERALEEIIKATDDENSWVKTNAKDIVKEKIRNMRRGLRGLDKDEKNIVREKIQEIKEDLRETKR